MLKKNIIIVSAGSYSREVYSFVVDCIDAGASWRVKGFLDDRPNILDDFPCPVNILDSVENYIIEPNDLFICAIGEPSSKKKYVEYLKSKGASFANLVHPTAVVGKNVSLGEGVVLTPYSILTASLSIGNFVSIGTMTVCSHHNQIGDWCHLSGHCSLAGGVKVGEGVFVGCSATFVPGVNIGQWAYIGAGSVVLKRVREHTKVFGNPAVPIGTVDDEV